MVSLLNAAGAGLCLFFVYRVGFSYLGQDYMGAWALISSLFLFARIGEFGVSIVFSRVIPLHIDNGDLRIVHEMVTWAFFGVFLASGLVVVIVGGLVFYLMAFPFDIESNLMLIVCSGLYSLLNALMAPLKGYFDGCGRSDIRQWGALVQSGMLLLGVCFLVPLSGRLGFLIALVVSALFGLLILLIWFKRSSLVGGGAGLKINQCGQLILEGCSLQATTLIGQLYEPFTKLLLSEIAGLHAVALFDLANRFVLQVRGVLISCLEVFVPYLSSLGLRVGSTRSHGALMEVYSYTNWAVVFVFSLLIVTIPLASVVWLSSVDFRFVIYSLFLILAWAVNSLYSPLHFGLIASGGYRYTLRIHAVMGGVNVFLGGICYFLGFDYGVVMAWAFSLIVGSFLQIKISNSLNLPVIRLDANQLWVALISCVVGCALCLLMVQQSDGYLLKSLFSMLVVFIAFFLNKSFRVFIFRIWDVLNFRRLRNEF